MDLDRALRNISLYEDVISSVILQRNYLNSINPDFHHSQTHHSFATLPYLLTEGTGTQTVLEFLTDGWEDVLIENLDELKNLLVPVADLFVEEQPYLAYKRLHDLSDLIEASLKT